MDRRALLGATYVLLTIVIGPRLGAAALLALVVTGQMVGAMVLDQNGWLVSLSTLSTSARARVQRCW